MTGQAPFRCDYATKSGRRLVFGQIHCYLPDGKRCASATTQYMRLSGG